MSDQIIKERDYICTYIKYGPTLLRFIRAFSPDEEIARKALDESIWLLLSEALSSPAYLSPFSRIMQIARQTTLDLLQRDPDFDPWAPWEREPGFFRLPENSLSRLHWELFNRLYFRGLSKADLAEKLQLSPAEIHQKIRETLRCINDTVARR